MEEQRNILTEGILIVGLSSIAYLGAYFFESGYAGHFRIPRELIEVDIRTVLSVGALLVASVGFFYYLLEVASSFHGLLGPETQQSGFVSLIRRHAIIAVAPTLFWLFSGAYAGDFLSLFQFQLIWLAVDLMVGLVLWKRAGGFWKGVALSLGNSAFDNGITSRILSSSKRGCFTLCMISLVLLVLCHAAGRGTARRRESFPIISPNHVILCRYGDQFVLAEIAAARKEILPVFTTRSIADPNLLFRIEKVGPFQSPEIPAAPAPKTDAKEQVGELPDTSPAANKAAVD